MPYPLCRTPWVLAAVLAAATSACSGEIAAPRASAGPARLVIVSGNAQTGHAGQELSQPLVVRVVDDNGDPVADQVVNFRVVSGGGSTFAGATETDVNGIAQDYWTLGPDSTFIPGQRLEVRAVNPTTGEKQVLGTFNAFSLNLPTFEFGRFTDSTGARVPVSARWGAQAFNRDPSYALTYVWDVGSNDGAWRMSGETASSLVYLYPPSNLSTTFWFCYYARNTFGERSEWQCGYFGAPLQ